MSLKSQSLPIDFLSLGSILQTEEEAGIVSDLMQKKINLQKNVEGIKESILKILTREWMEERESIKVQIQNNNGSDDEVLFLAKRFDELKKNQPSLLV
jgi:DNA primase